MNDREPAASPCATETVWDGGLSGTGLSADGQLLTVGPEGGWSPEQLLLLGAEGSFMDSFLVAAREANLPILGYVSSGHLDLSGDPHTPPRITLRPCVVVGSVADVERAFRIVTTAMRQSIVGRLLGDQLRVGLDVQPEVSSSQQPPWRASKN